MKMLSCYGRGTTACGGSCLPPSKSFNLIVSSLSLRKNKNRGRRTSSSSRNRASPKLLPKLGQDGLGITTFYDPQPQVVQQVDPSSSYNSYLVEKETEDNNSNHMKKNYVVIDAACDPELKKFFWHAKRKKFFAQHEQAGDAVLKKIFDEWGGSYHDNDYQTETARMGYEFLKGKYLDEKPKRPFLHSLVALKQVIDNEMKCPKVTHLESSCPSETKELLVSLSYELGVVQKIMRSDHQGEGNGDN